MGHYDMLQKHLRFVVYHQLRRRALYHRHAKVKMPKKLPFGAVCACKAKLAHDKLPRLCNVMQYYARVHKLTAERGIKPLIYAYYGLRAFKHCKRMVKQSPAHGVVQLQRGGPAHKRLLILLQKILRDELQIGVVKPFGNSKYLVIHFLRALRRAGHQLAHVHFFIGLQIAYAVYFKLLPVFPHVYRGAHLYDRVRFV